MHSPLTMTRMLAETTSECSKHSARRPMRFRSCSAVSQEQQALPAPAFLCKLPKARLQRTNLDANARRYSSRTQAPPRETALSVVVSVDNDIAMVVDCKSALGLGWPNGAG